MSNTLSCPVCLDPFAEDRPAVRVRFAAYRKSPRHAWKPGGSELVCEACAQTPNAGRDGKDNLISVHIQEFTDGWERTHCEHCEVPVLLKPNARRKAAACSPACRSALVRRAKSVPVAVTRTCDGCGTELVGRSDRRYCSPACRQRVHRKRNGVRVTAGETVIDPEVPRRAPRGTHSSKAHASVIDSVCRAEAVYAGLMEEMKCMDGLDDSISPKDAAELLARFKEAGAARRVMLAALEARAARTSWNVPEPSRRPRNG